MENKKLNPVILIGFGRSGTSIIADIILSHSELAVVSNYNAKFPNNKYVNLILLLFQNKLYNFLGQKKQINKTSIINSYIFRNSESYNFHNLINEVDFGKRFLNNVKLAEEQADKIRDKYNEVAKYQFKDRLGFKLTGPSKIKYLNQIFPDAYFVHIKRQPLPNIRSLLKVGFYQDRKHDLWWEGDSVYSEQELEFAKQNKNRPELIAALQYYKIDQFHNKEIKELDLEGKVITINYEDFIKEPHQQVDKILTFVELKQDKKIKKFMEMNEIFNRNKKEKYYFSEKIDKEVNEIATFGC